MHLVMFTSAEGKAATHQADSLEEALKFVEHIHNVEGVSDARLFRMSEVPLEVKAYYKVELASAPDLQTNGAAAPAPAVAAS